MAAFFFATVAFFLSTVAFFSAVAALLAAARAAAFGFIAASLAVNRDLDLDYAPNPVGSQGPEVHVPFNWCGFVLIDYRDQYLSVGSVRQGSPGAAAASIDDPVDVEPRVGQDRRIANDVNASPVQFVLGSTSRDECAPSSSVWTPVIQGKP